MIVQANSGFSKLLNKKKNDIIGLNLRDSPVSAQAGYEIESRVLESLEGKHSTFEIKFNPENGPQYFTISTLPIILGDGTNGSCLIADNITDRKLLEKTLSESEQKYRTLVNAIGDMVFVIDKDYYLVQVHTSKYDMFPIMHDDDIVGQHVSEFLPPDITIMILGAVQEVKATTKPKSVEFPIEIEETRLWFSAVLTLHEDNESVVVLVRNITKQKTAELKLEKSEQKFRSVFTNAGLGMTVVDLDNRLIDVNSVYQEMLGYSRDEILERSWIDFTHPDDVEPELALFEEMLRLDQDLFRLTKRCIRKDGSAIWTKLIVTIIRDTQNRPQFTIGMIDDITRQHQMEIELRESDDRFRATFYESPIGINIFDSEGALIHINRSLHDIFGMQHDADIDFNIFEDPNLPEEMKERMRKAETFRFDSDISFDKIRKTGYYRTSKSGKIVVDAVVGPLGIDEHGNPTGYIIQTNDITERIFATKELEKMNKFYKTILDKIVNGVIVHDRNDEITYINEAGLKITGLPIERVLGTNILTGFPKESFKNVRELYLNAKMNLEPQRFDSVTITSPTGQRFHQSGWLIPLFKENQYDGMIVTIEDITSLKEVRDKEQEHIEFLETVIESLDYPFYVIDADDYTIKMANSASRLGYQGEGSTCYELTHQKEQPCDGEHHPCPLKEVKKTKKSVILEHVHSCEDGKVQTMEIHAHPVFDTKENVTSIIEYMIDITERKKVEDELRISESRYRSLFKNSSIPLLEEDWSQVKEFFDKLRNGGVTDFRDHFENHPDEVEQCVNLVRVLDVNKASMDLIGVQKKDEILGILAKNFGRDGLGVFRKELVALAEGRTFFRSKDVPLNVRGKECILSFQLSVPPGFEESLSRVYLSIIDMTNRFDTLKALRRSEEISKVVFDNTSEGIFKAVLETRTIKFINFALCKILGYTRSELIGMSVEDIHPKESVKSITTLYDALSWDKEVERGTDIPCLRKDGTIIYANIRISVVKIEDKDYLIGFFSEISRQEEILDFAGST
jgi:PAS domain S-box-containing protein